MHRPHIYVSQSCSPDAGLTQRLIRPLALHWHGHDTCCDASRPMLAGCQGSICGAPLNNDIRDVLNGNLQLCAILQECQVRPSSLMSCVCTMRGGHCAAHVRTWVIILSPASEACSRALVTLPC